MCGIAGFLARGRLEREPAARLEAMAQALAHRGPDAADAWLDPGAGIALAHRRLSILDLSPRGGQPMRSHCGRYVITYNGEVYNVAALRAELEGAAGPIAWQGHSDTEVMLAAIGTWGLEPALAKFVGMFAFALWDGSERSLTLVRDRLGEKPLYYAELGGELVFASELKALKRHPAWRGEVERGALALLLRYGYVPAPYSIFRGVHKLEPGTLLRATARGIERRAYWSAKELAERAARERLELPDGEAVAELERLLGDAVAQQMVADVPLGAFLSGGIDSSTVVALMQARSRIPVKTFSIGFREERFDEARHARAVARHLGTEHHELYVSAQEAMAVVPRLPAIYDEPFADPSQMPTCLLAAMTRRHVKVSLSGDGGDELFGGYRRYRWGRLIWGAAGWLPGAARRRLARLIESVPLGAWERLAQPVSGTIAGPADKLHRLARYLGAADAEGVYRGLVSNWETAMVRDALEPPDALTDPARRAALPGLTERMMFLDAVSYLPDDILVKLDRASMAVGLESRVPLLDHRVVEFAWRLPLAMKLRAGTDKWLLRQLLYRHVPRALVERPKMGFGVPLDAWLRGPLRAWAEELLSDPRLGEDGLLDAARIRAKWAEHLEGRRNWQQGLWSVLMFQAWRRVQ
jgi:asparagine synthase (glutamine-hydrolysing)